MMNIRNKIACIITIAAIAAIALSIGCKGSATAPPVELPAPVIGKINVGTPDANGKSTIIGQPGAVTSGANVLAINERLVATNTLWRITDALVPNAQAALEDCEGVGRWVTTANADGSFVLIIDALVGDNIILVLIDENCIELSERVTLIVPSLAESAAICADLGLDGSMTGLFNADGGPIMLFQGSESGQSKVMVGISETQIPGCFAKHLVTIPAGTSNPAKVIAISPDDRLVWKGSLDGAPFGDTKTYQLADVPLGGAYIGEANKIALLVRTPTRLAIVKFDFEAGVIDAIIDIPEISGYTYGELVAMPTIGPFNDGGYLGTVMLKADSANTGNTTVATIYETTGFTSAIRDGFPVDLAGSFSLGFGEAGDITDAVLTVDSTFDRNVHLIVADHGNGKLRPVVFSLTSSVINPISLIGDVGIYTNNLYMVWDDLHDAEPTVLTATPRKLSIGIGGSFPTIYSLVDDTSGTCNLWALFDMLGSMAPNNCDLIGASDPVLISADDGTKTILVGDNDILGIVDASQFWVP